MNQEQKIVAVGAASGVASMIALIALLYHLLPNLSGADQMSDRLAFALQMNVFAVIPLFVWLAMVGNARFLSQAIDPLYRAAGMAATSYMNLGILLSVLYFFAF